MHFSSAGFIKYPKYTMERAVWLCLPIIALITDSVILVLCTTTSVCSTWSVNCFHSHCCLGVILPFCVFPICCYHFVLVLTCELLLLAVLKHSLDGLRITSSPDQSFCLHIPVCCGWLAVWSAINWGTERRNSMAWTANGLIPNRISHSCLRCD